MRLAWITDPHFNFLPPAGTAKFAKYVRRLTQADAIVMTGDIAECPSLAFNLVLFASKVEIPVYFVLGNHDFYNGSLEKGRLIAQVLHDSQAVKNLSWLNAAGVVELTPEIALVGHGGWYDARSGDPEGSNVIMNDFKVIEEFRDKERYGHIEKCREVAKQMAEEARPNLVAAARKYKQVFFATHIPPFRESCFYRDRISDKNWLPWFTNLTFGAMLADVASLFPEVKFTVLCGHTHSPGEYKHFENLTVYTGHSDYGNPQVSKIFSLGLEAQGEAESPADAPLGGSSGPLG